MENPYSSSVGGLDPFIQSQGNVVQPGILQALSGTKPWVRLCSVMGFIGTGLIALVAIAMIVMGIFMSTSSDLIGPAGGAPMVFGSLFYLFFAFLNFFPLLKLWKYGSYINSLLSTGSVADLELALDAQRSFWKFVGIMILIGIGIQIISIVIVMLVAAAGASALV